MTSSLYEVDKFRVSYLTKLDKVDENHKLIFKKCSIQEGLAIDVKCNRDSYIAIAVVHRSGNKYEYESIGDRIEDYCKSWEDVLNFRECLDYIKTLFESLGGNDV